MITKYLKKKRSLIDKELDRYLPKRTVHPRIIHEAMRYSVLNGGKRIRPILVLESSRVCGGKMKNALPLACAIELIHSYSLIHDDLPSMDDADTRRGIPAAHVKYGEALAILAGDSLLTLAFNLVSRESDRPVPIQVDGRKSRRGDRPVPRSPEQSEGSGVEGRESRQRREDKTKIGKIVFELSKAIGSFGMIGGQVMDLKIREEKKVDLPTMEYINLHKTASLITAAAKTGAIMAGARDKEIEALQKYGEYAGLAFQIVDDMLDRDGYVEIFGPKGAGDESRRLVERAKDTLKMFGEKADNLREIADYILERKR